MSFRFLIILVSLTFLFGCTTDSNNTDSSTTSSQVTSLDKVPGATTPVVTEGTVLEKVKKFASTGKVLKDLSTTQFSDVSPTTNRSRGSCETLSILKQVYKEATQPDKTKCYVAAVAGLASELNLTIDETGSKYNYFQIAQDSGTGSVKFKIKKEGGYVTQFEMFDCMNEEGTSAGESKGGYINALLTSSGLNMTVKNIGSYTQGSDSGDYSMHITVIGKINSEGKYTEKQLVARTINSGSYSNGTYSSSAKATVDEFKNQFKLNAFMTNLNTGSWNDGSTNYYYKNSNTTRAYSETELINSTPGSMITLAAGNGTVKAILDGKWAQSTTENGVDSAFSNCTTSGENCWIQTNQTVSEAWNGDGDSSGSGANVTVASSAANGYNYANVNAATPPTVETVTIAFEDSEKWDCTSTGSEEFQSFTMESGSAAAEAIAACNAIYGNNDGDWIDCWQLEEKN